jgi:mono/diheme cytochrome c family protein
MKRGTLILIILVAFAGTAVAVAASLIHDGLSARATPSALEVALARRARRLAIPADARATKNPLAPSTETLHDARLHFADHCSICHSNDGGGDNMIGQGLYPKPPDLRRPRTQNLSDGELFWIIENGVRFTGMPAFSSHGTQDDSWKLVLFIRHLPQLTPGERAEMERYNPKGPDDRAEEQEEDNFLDGAPPKKGATPEHHHH